MAKSRGGSGERRVHRFFQDDRTCGSAGGGIVLRTILPPCYASVEEGNQRMSDQRSELYRASTRELDSPAPHLKTWRMPGNVSYLVDNLWEWTRPTGLPSRRTAAFASPTIKEAKESQPEGLPVFVYRVKLPTECTIVQLKGHADAKDHPDKRQLVEAVKVALTPEYFSLPLVDKGEVANLFCPGLHADEVESIVSRSEKLRGIGLRDRITFWNSISRIDPEKYSLAASGEVFFTVPEDGYCLERVE